MWGWRRCSMASGVRRALGGRLRPIGPGRHRWRPVLARERGRATADAEARPCSRLLSPAALAGARGMAAGVVVAAWSFGPDREVAYAACGCSIGRAGLRAACKCARAQWPPSTPGKGGRSCRAHRSQARLRAARLLALSDTLSPRPVSESPRPRRRPSGPADSTRERRQAHVLVHRIRVTGARAGPAAGLVSASFL